MKIKFDIFLIIILINLLLIYILRNKVRVSMISVMLRAGVFAMIYTLVLGLPFLLSIWGRTWLIGVFGANWWILPLGLMAILATVGPFIYIYVERKAENRLLKEQRRYQDTLKQASVGMTRIRDLERLLSLIVHIFTKSVRISHSVIYLFDEKSEQFLLKAGRNLKSNQPTSINKEVPLIIWLNNRREPLIYKEIKRMAQGNSNPIFKELVEQMHILNASVLVPSFLENRLLAILVLGDKRSGAIYTGDDLDTFSVLANQLALAIENAIFIKEAVSMDFLTLLWNHTYFQTKLNEQISDAKKLKKRFSLVFLDIDNFKNYNDKYGHLIGDKVLCAFSQIIKENLKKGDVAARYGGEEFAIILDGVGKENAIMVAERIRKLVESKNFLFDNGKKHLNVKITLSGGVVTYPIDVDATNNEELIGLVDEMLYKAKQTGKNKICFPHIHMKLEPIVESQK